MIQTFDIYIYLAEIQSLRFIPLRTIEENTIFNTLEQQIYRTSFLLSLKKKKNLRLNRPYIFHSFPPIIPFYRGLNGKPIVSVRGARREGEKKREREKKGGGDVSKRRVKRCTFKLFALVRKD